MNRIVLCVLVLAAIIAVGFSKLCTPDQWQGGEASFGGYIHHRRPGIIKEHSFVAYDAINKRKASFIDYVNNDYENKFQIVVRYDDDGDDHGKIYYVDMKKDECWVKRWDKPFRKACLPDDAEFVHDYTLGPAEGGLKVSGYLAKKERAGVYIAVVKSGDVIVPVTETVHGDFMGTNFIQGIQFAGITTKINESVFDIPKQCEEGEPIDSISDYLMREQFFLAV